MENQVVGSCCDLIGGEWDSSSVGKVDGRFEWLVDVLRGCHARGVLLKVYGGNLVVINIEVSNHLEAT